MAEPTADPFWQANPSDPDKLRVLAEALDGIKRVSDPELGTTNLQFVAKELRDIASRLSTSAHRAEGDAKIIEAATNGYFVQIVKGHRQGYLDVAEKVRDAGKGDLLDLSLKALDDFLAALSGAGAAGDADAGGGQHAG